MLDVGANIGLFSMFASERAGASGRVIALEPVPQVAAACSDNTARHATWCLQRTGRAAAPCEVIAAAAGRGDVNEATFSVYSK